MIFIVLYISIVERTKEIGILRAIGAQKKDIKHMFMYEAGILGLIGGVIGVVFAILVTLLTNVITEITMDASLMNIHFLYILLGILISISISIFAGIAPSIKASQLDPIESLRFE
jgi:ABC-type antimicrobial peptide transport system permease subunit